MNDTIILELDPTGAPVRLLWDSRPYIVTDQPTELEPDHWLITHPPRGFTGWRFQGTDERGDSLVFDVCATPDDRWRLLRVYD